MVRINIINPRKLADQHLIAEYGEILMLLNHAKKHPGSDGNQPRNYCLGKGHINFFKNKLLYLKKRHETIKEEMKKRGFKARKTVRLDNFNKKSLHSWKPRKKDYKIIKIKLKEKIRKKPGYYRYYRKGRPLKFFDSLLK